jgi:hypothetical protein
MAVAVAEAARRSRLDDLRVNFEVLIGLDVGFNVSIDVSVQLGLDVGVSVTICLRLLTEASSARGICPQDASAVETDSFLDTLSFPELELSRGKESLLAHQEPSHSYVDLAPSALSCHDFHRLGKVGDRREHESLRAHLPAARPHGDLENIDVSANVEVAVDDEEDRSSLARADREHEQQQAQP